MTNSPLAQGDLLAELEIRDLTVDGGALARHEGLVVFLDSGLPGDVVQARVQSTRKRLVRATVERTLRRSQQWQAPWCPHFGECGACSWQNFSPSALLAWKEEHVRQTLRRLGGGEPVHVEAIAASPAQREYRNKMAFAFGLDSQKKTILGLRKNGSHDIVEVTECRLQSRPAMKILEHVRGRIPELGLTAWDDKGRGHPAEGELRFLVIHSPVYAQEGAQLIVECICGQSPDAHKGERSRNSIKLRQLGEELMGSFGVSGFIHSERVQRSPLAQAEQIIFSLGESVIAERFHHLLLKAPHDCFMQTNTLAAKLLYARATECAALTGAEILWDVYCGVGGLGLYMAEKAKAVCGFDIQASAIRAAEENSRRLGYDHCRFFAGDLGQSLRKAEVLPDVIILDPPRAGMDEQVARILADLPAERIVYISCDVGTQARDVDRLRKAGWQAACAYPVDMFPHGPHIENIVLLLRDKA